MLNKFLGQVGFLRHGESGYTNVYPDLTPEGIKTIKKSALLIPFFNGNRNIEIFSSPKTRAIGSVDIITKMLSIKQRYQIAPALSAVEIKDEEKAKKLFAEVSQGGGSALSIAYNTDPRFEDGIILESRSEVKKRFFSFFSDLTKWFAVNMSWPLSVIAVSHYEVLYHFVEGAFKLDYEKDAPLGYGEIIMINIYESKARNTVIIEIVFRGKKTEMFFNYRKGKIV